MPRGRPKGSKNKPKLINPYEYTIPKVKNKPYQSPESKILHDYMKNAAFEVYQELLDAGVAIRVARKLNQCQIPFGIGALEPDTGIVIYKGKFIFASEAKWQTGNENVIERWHDNARTLRDINPSITYLTLTGGAGIVGLLKSLNKQHLGEVDTDHLFYNTVYHSINGFSYDQVKEHIRRLLVATIEGINNNETAIYVGRWEDKINQALSTISTEDSTYIL